MVLQKLAICAVFTIFLGENPIIYSPAPRGDCPKCCPLIEKADIRFLLYTRSNPKHGSRLLVGDHDLLGASAFNTSHPTVLFLHGFSERAPGITGSAIRDAYLQRGVYNVILVDWGPLTAVPWYGNAVANSARTGRYTALFIKFLFNSGLQPSSLHVLGFSIGAAAAGTAGKALREWGTPLRRITGMDPAFPLYMVDRANRRLSADDADFVDVIHTDGGLFGYPWPLGHADFYPNGGVATQPGCSAPELATRRALSRIVSCGHQRAWRYYVESVMNPQAFPVKCPTCPPGVPSFMGEAADHRLRGKFYLTTNSDSPFGRNFA